MLAEPPGGGVVVGDGVHGSFDSLETTEVGFVGHGVGEAFGGPGRVDLVAVVVEPGVEIAQGERAVLAEDRAAGGAEAAAGDGSGVGLGRGDGCLVDRWRSPALMAGIDGPELFASFVDGGEGVEAGSGELIDLLVDLAEVVEEIVAVGLEADALGAGQAGPAAVGPESSAGGDVDGFGQVGRGWGVVVVEHGAVLGRGRRHGVPAAATEDGPVGSPGSWSSCAGPVTVGCRGRSFGCLVALGISATSAANPGGFAADIALSGWWRSGNSAIFEGSGVRAGRPARGGAQEKCAR